MSTLSSAEVARLRVRPADAPIRAEQAHDWPALWHRLRDRLRGDGYRPGTVHAQGAQQLG